MFNYILECVPPHYLGDNNMGANVGQGGNAITYVEGEYQGILVFDTVMHLNGAFYYLGQLPEFKT